MVVRTATRHKLLPRHYTGLGVGYGGTGCLVALLAAGNLSGSFLTLCSMVALGKLCGGAFDSLGATLFGIRRRRARYESKCDSGYEAIERAFRHNFDTGMERQAQCVAYVGGKKVVDLCGAVDDEQCSDYGPDSLQYVFRRARPPLPVSCMLSGLARPMMACSRPLRTARQRQ